MKKTALIDVPVAIIFFIRHNTLAEVFEQVKKARPSKLFLIQDGARESRQLDEVDILKCRKIVEDIDWECKVYKNYAEVNLGCGFRPYSGISWVFEHVDRAIVLEDDCVPSLSFFPFCQELLEKYKEDQRVNMIAGMNYMDRCEDKSSSYFFAKNGTNWGWATWKRAWSLSDYNLDLRQDKETINLLSRYLSPQDLKFKLSNIEEIPKSIAEKNCSIWDFQWGMVKHLHFGITIIPKYNLIKNIGYGEGNTHSSELAFMAKEMRSLFNKKVFELEFPLKHPHYMIQDFYYDGVVDNILKPAGMKLIMRKVKSLVRRIAFGGMGEITKMITSRLK